MSFNARNNRYDPSRRRRRRNIHSHPSSSHSPLTTLATTAAVAYGAYRLGSWAWNAYVGKDEEDEYAFGEGSGYDSESESDDNNDFDQNPSESSPRKDFRSRRSRGDWSEYNHRHRSNPHSPHHDHQNDSKRSSNNGSTNSAGVGEKIMATTTAAIGAAVSAGISAGINAYNNNQNTAASAQFLRSSRMDRCRLEASRAMMDFLPTLKKAIIKETDITAEMEELKSSRAQKKGNGGGEQSGNIRLREGELWNSIKNKSITRLVTTIYAHTIVFLVLTVQVNLLGGRLLREEQQEESQEEQASSPSSDGSDRYRSSHKTVLAKTYHHVFSTGIPALVEAVGKATDDVLQNWDVLGGDDVSLDDVSSWMETVRDSIEKRQQKGISSALVQFIIPDGAEQSSEESMDELARYILDETYDLLESPTYAHAERMCLNITFTHLRVDGYAKLFPPPTINDMREEEENDGEERKPLAKVITHLQKQTVATFYKPPSHEEEMKDWEGVFRMMEEPLPSAPNVYIPKFFDAVTELSDISFN
mmetsp:Transcript_17916/g.27432  ORF Transcript_17916/g.27432 Transcript_17916/m.27432 type:complete len:532 (+) Transcript_17916:198-1793(+)